MSGGFRFLDLPPGIRNLIYQELLVLPEPVVLVLDEDLDLQTPYPCRTVLWLALLRANRQIYHEARRILYSQNTFVVGQPVRRCAVLPCFLDCIGPENADHLRDLHMCVLNLGDAIHQVEDEDEVRFADLKALRRCTNLQTVQDHVLASPRMGLTVGTYNSANDEFVRDGLRRIHAILQSTPSRPTALISVWDHPFAPQVSELMKIFGWEME